MSDRLDVERRVQSVLRRQYSLITTDQARKAGLTYQAIGRRQAAGRFDTVVRGLLRDAGQPVTQHQRILAAVLCHGSPAFASGRSSAYLYKADGYRGGNVSLAVAEGVHHTNRLASVQRFAGLERRDTRRVDNIPCLSPEATLLTLAPRVTFDSLEETFVDLAGRRLLTAASVENLLERHGRRGRNGVCLLRELAQRWSGVTPPATVGELKVGRLLRTHGLRVDYQFAIDVGRGVTLHADLGLPDLPMVVVEYQSERHHSTRRAARDDATRMQLMTAVGFHVIPASADDLIDGGARLAAACLAAGAARAA